MYSSSSSAMHHIFFPPRLKVVFLQQDPNCLAPCPGDQFAFDRFLGHQRSEEHTSELQSLRHLVCRLLLEKKKKTKPAKSRQPPGHPTPRELASGVREEEAEATPRLLAYRLPDVDAFGVYFFFFLMEAAPPEFTLFPHPALFRF